MNSEQSLWGRISNSNVFYHFVRDKVAFISASILLLIILAAIFAPLLTSHNPNDLATLDVMDGEIPPVWTEEGDERFLLGTDDQGRDILSAILYGARVSLLIGICAVVLQCLLGVIIGLVAGYAGGRVDSLLMRLADIQLSFSSLMLAIIVLAFFRAFVGGDLYSQFAMVILIFVIGVAEWPQYARTIRACVLAEKEKEYVQAAQVMGFTTVRIMFRHILPNCLSPIFVISTVQIANAIISEAALSFLGLGMPVTQPSLGSLIKSGFDYLQSGQWWITIIPGLFLIVLVLVINLLGDWLRDVLNPKLYKG
ncbi:ABC transporter permease [Zooshikella marina]|uniref:ABC transporter permease n=1 Tax=Zooshikella ganghwensis TaxID=202772 RepID=A0A4P9VRH0_9GAMM|nr:ABC transporter permease [Zooshikella ganghwensis]MBU2707619.1 ABC transporter permease [Zooshikella ganghwensis]RDH44732.1 ABC transporter permease [Zooshikella ganghwensis]